MLDLGGDAAGYSLVVPAVGRAVGAQNTVGVELDVPTIWAFDEGNVEETDSGVAAKSVA